MPLRSRAPCARLKTAKKKPTTRLDTKKAAVATGQRLRPCPHCLLDPVSPAQYFFDRFTLVLFLRRFVLQKLMKKEMMWKMFEN